MAGWFDENAHPAWFLDPNRMESPGQMAGQPGEGPASSPVDYGDDTRGIEEAYLMPGDGRTGGDFGGPRQDFTPTPSPDFGVGGGYAGGINPPGRTAPAGDMNAPPNFSGWIGHERGMTQQDFTNMPPGGSAPPMPAPPVGGGGSRVPVGQLPAWMGAGRGATSGGGPMPSPGGAPLGMVGNPNNWGGGGQGAPPMGLAQHLMNGGQSVTMRGPTGQIVQVPNTVVQHFMAQGATVVR